MIVKRRYQCVQQENETDCGAACIATICLFYGKNIDISSVGKLAHVDRYGANMLGLQAAAQKLGFDAEGLSGTYEEFISSDLTLPCIAHIIIDDSLEHFVVVFEVSDNTLIIGDPAKGIAEYSADEFKAKWSGHILVLCPNKAFKGQKRDTKYLQNFLRDAAKSNKRTIWIVASLSLCSALLSVGASYFMYYLIDTILPGTLVTRLVGSAGVACLLYLLILLLNRTRNNMSAALSEKVGNNLMTQYISQLLQIRYDFYEQHTTGDLISRLQDTDIVRDAVCQILTTALADLVMAIVSLCALLFLDPPLFFASMFIVVVYAITVAKYNTPIQKISTELRDKDASTSTLFLETVRGIETIKSYQAETDIAGKNKDRISALMDCLKRASILFSNQSTLADTIMSIGEIFVLSIGGIQIINNALTLGRLVMFYSLLSMCLSPIKNLIGLLPTIHKSEASAHRLCDVLAESVEETQPCTKLAYPLTGDIDIEELSFRYGNRDLILDGLSFHIKGGERIALIGNNGAGKSTFIKILLGLYRAESGSITINGNNVDSLPLQAMRRKISYVPQNTFLMRGSVLDNIRIGNHAMSEESIIRFLNATPFKSFIDQLPMGYQSILTENGANLSGGQRQMISVARALIKQGDILILDEATSAIDKQTEKLIQDTVCAVCPHTTTIVISHHHALNFCNHIVMLDKGRVVADGTHEELLQESPLYQQYCGL